MKNSPQTAPSLITRDYARQKNVETDTVRRRLKKTGSYFNDIPARGSNGRLLWPVPAAPGAAVAGEVL